MSNIPVISPAINYITRFFKDKEALHKAVQNGEREEILNLIKIGYNPNALDKFGKTPLFYATERQDCRFYIELLLKNGASVNARDVNGRTCLHKAGKYLAKMLISYEADLNIQDKLGNTALHYAAKRGDWDLIDTLSTKENFYIKNSEGKTAFDLLIKSIENISPEAIENKVGSYAKSLIKCKKYLSDNEQDIYNSSLEKLLYIGGIVDQSLILEELFFKDTPIITGAAHYIVRSCFGNNGALHRAVQEEDISRITRLLDQGYDINAKDEYGETPLMLLINRQYKGKDFDLQESESVLHFLVRKGADINAQDNEGKTYLHKTSVPFLAKILISYGADLNIQDKLGNTALHYTAKNGNWPMINVLATKDNITIANEAGETAFDVLMSEIENMEQTGKLKENHILRSDYIKTYESLNKHFTEQEQNAHLQKLLEISETMSLNFAEDQDGLLGSGVSEQNSPNI